MAELRKAADLSQGALGRLIGEKQQNIAFWEQSDKPPRSDVLPKLARVLGVSVEQLLDVKAPITRRNSPVGKVRQLFEEVSELPAGEGRGVRLRAGRAVQAPGELSGRRGRGGAQDMHYPVIVRAEAEDRYVARPLGLPELEASASTEAEAIERVRQALDRWMTTAKLVEVDVATAAGRNPWLDTFGRSADDPDFEEFQAELARRRADDAAAG